VRYIQFAGFNSNTTDKLLDTDLDLPVYEQHLALLRKRLAADGDYTYLVLFDGTQTEVVQLTNHGGSLKLTRALEDTPAQSFPTGTCVRWEITPAAVRDIVCQMECCP
jgi:hypothetical protein